MGRTRQPSMRSGAFRPNPWAGGISSFVHAMQPQQDRLWGCMFTIQRLEAQCLNAQQVAHCEHGCMQSYAMSVGFY